MVQMKALNPKCIELFHSYGCSSPVVCAGWAGKENNLEELGIDVIPDILKVLRKPFQIPQAPNTLFKLRWFGVCGMLSHSRLSELFLNFCSG